MNKTFNKIFFSVFVVFWLLVALINVITPYKEFSENENKYFSKFPSFSFEGIVNGEYMHKVENYINEQFLLRDNWISIQSVLEYGSGKRENNGVYIGKDALFEKISQPEDKKVEANIDAINFFVEQTKIPTKIMLVPSASDIQSDTLPAFADAWSQKELADSVYEKTTADGISVYETLSEHKNEYIFYRTDHHWTTYGSYLAYVEYCKALGLTPVEYSAKTVSETFNGTLYSKSGVRFMESDVIESFNIDHDTSLDIMELPTNPVKNDSIYFDERLETKDKYTYFLGDNKPVITARAENGIDRKLLVFKDSYSHCMAPMLLEHYGEITFIDIRYVKQSLDKYIDISEYDDALFLYSVDGFANQNNLGILKYFIKPTQE